MPQETRIQQNGPSLEQQKQNKHEGLRYYGEVVADNRVNNPIFGIMTPQEALKAEKMGAMVHTCEPYCSWSIPLVTQIVASSDSKFGKNAGDVETVVAPQYYKFRSNYVSQPLHTQSAQSPAH